MFERINDLLALLLLIVIIPALWLIQGLSWVNMPDSVVGATIAVWTLVAQYYFRRAPPAKTPPGTTP